MSRVSSRIPGYVLFLSAHRFESLEMAAYHTRAVQRPPGFYRALHNSSTADSDFSGRAKSLPAADLNDEDVYEVERLVQCRRGKVSCCFVQPFIHVHYKPH